MRVGINGMGRIGRLALRAAFGAAHRPDDDPRRHNRLDVVQVNEIKGGAQAIAHLLTFDSVQGKWRESISATEQGIQIGERLLSYTSEATPAAINWAEHGVDVVLEVPANF